jgi:hypothetical protein
VKKATKKTSGTAAKKATPAKKGNADDTAPF